MFFLIVLQIVIIEHKSIICPGYNAVLHIHTCIEEVEITVSVRFSCDVNTENPLVRANSALTYICRATNAAQLQPWMESLVSTVAQPSPTVTVSISLLKSVLSHDWLAYAGFFIIISKSFFLGHLSFVWGGNKQLSTHSFFFFFLLQALICLVDKKTGEKSKTRPRFVKQDQVCIARLRTAGTICLETFKDFPQMGRFTLRDEGKTARATVIHRCKNAVIWNRRSCMAMRS